MAAQESYYTGTGASGILTSTSPGTGSYAPPPPPPKPTSHDPSRRGTPTTSVQVQQTPTAHDVHTQAGPPLPPLPSQSSSAGRPQSPSGTSSQVNQGQSRIGFQSQSHSKTVSPPPINSGWLPSTLERHSTADLQAALSDPELLAAFARQHPSYASSLEPLQSAISSNLTSAHDVSQLEAQVKQLRDQTTQLLLNHTSLQTQWRRKQSEMDDALSPWGPRAMYSRLVSSINEQEAILRAVHESFLEGAGGNQETYGHSNGKATDKEVTDWLKRIRDGTTTLEKRREMRARWDEGRVGGWR